MPKRNNFNIHPLVAQDILALVEGDLRLLALKKIKLIKEGKLQGRPLSDKKSTGDLSDCRKVLFDTRNDIPPRFRIVYRELKNDIEVVAVEILSVGERFELEAYIQAAIRLERLNPKPPQK